MELRVKIPIEVRNLETLNELYCEALNEAEARVYRRLLKRATLAVEEYKKAISKTLKTQAEDARQVKVFKGYATRNLNEIVYSDIEKLSDIQTEVIVELEQILKEIKG